VSRWRATVTKLVLSAEADSLCFAFAFPALTRWANEYRRSAAVKFSYHRSGLARLTASNGVIFLFNHKRGPWLGVSFALALKRVVVFCCLRGAEAPLFHGAAWVPPFWSCLFAIRHGLLIRESRPSRAWTGHPALGRRDHGCGFSGRFGREESSGED